MRTPLGFSRIVQVGILRGHSGDLSKAVAMTKLPSYFSKNKSFEKGYMKYILNMFPLGIK